MKKTHIFSFILIALTVWLAGCDRPPQKDQATVQVVATNSFNRTIEHKFIQKISQVSGFEHQFDTTFLMITNETSGQQLTLIDPIDPIFGNIALSIAPHNFFMKSREADSVSEFLEFTAISGMHIQINPGINQLELPMVSNQGLNLIDTTGIEGWPRCQVGTLMVPMSRYGKWWYNYVKGDAIIQFKSDGADKQKFIPFMKETIQVYSPATGEVRVSDSFQSVKQI